MAWILVQGERRRGKEPQSEEQQLTFYRQNCGNQSTEQRMLKPNAARSRLSWTEFTSLSFKTCRRLLTTGQAKNSSGPGGVRLSLTSRELHSPVISPLATACALLSEVILLTVHLTFCWSSPSSIRQPDGRDPKGLGRCVKHAKRSDIYKNQWSRRGPTLNTSSLCCLQLSRCQKGSAGRHIWFDLHLTRRPDVCGIAVTVNLWDLLRYAVNATLVIVSFRATPRCGVQQRLWRWRVMFITCSRVHTQKVIVVMLSEGFMECQGD